MPISIGDRRLSTLYSNWERTAQPIGKDQALEILAQVGDSSKWSAVNLLAELKKPGMTTEKQIALANAGMSANEKRDIATILDQGTRWFEYNRQPRRHSDRLDGLTIVNAFFENSTRTLLSFEIEIGRAHV